MRGVFKVFVENASQDPPEESQRVGKESAPADTDDAWDTRARRVGRVGFNAAADA